ncbi:MAG: dioxygenase [Betaproteobacteria bacterium]|nr:dioxygenase [Betaproteobacteria bacterium]
MSAAMFELPTVFIPHGGGPCFFMDWNPPDTWRNMQSFLEGLAAQLAVQPKAVVVISGHWEAPQFTVNSAAKPPLLYDYYGFPEHTYRLEYPAAGSPELAQRIANLLTAEGFACAYDSERGLDHGVFIPLKLIYPEADVPIVQLSLRHGLDPAEHLRAGEALAPLRKEGILLVGSGMSYHNLRAFGPIGAAASQAFDAWLTATLEMPDVARRNTLLTHWTEAPAARQAHPREEHLLPLMVVAGAAGDAVGTKIYADKILGMTLSAFRFG